MAKFTESPTKNLALLSETRGAQGVVAIELGLIGREVRMAQLRIKL